MKSNIEQENPRQLKLTDANVARLRAPTASGRPQITWDTDIKGLGVLCGGTGATKTYVVRFTVKGQAKRPRLKLGWTGTTTLAEAKRKARDYINQGVGGVNPKDEERKKARAAKGNSLASVLTRYAEDCRALGKIAEGSIEQNEGNIRRHLADWLSLPLKAITEQMVLERHAELPAIIAKSRKRTTGRCQANHVMRSLRTVFNHATELDEGLGRNPVEVLGRRDRWYPENKRADYVAAHQMEKFWAAVEALPNDMHRDILLFTLLTGLRRKNVLSLRWKQIDFAGRAIRFEPHQMKSRRRHELPMSDYLCMLMEKRATEGKAEWIWPAIPTK
ncbi:MAG: tyrosine-type recombinase/integrase, partial [Prosthecobacter sp.]|nr:tyrosine-type recombinase/integrase [Prosthecobacter sp.]